MLAVKIIAIIIAVLFVLTFTVYITNADGKLVEKMYRKLLKEHDAKNVEERI